MKSRSWFRGRQHPQNRRRALRFAAPAASVLAMLASLAAPGAFAGAPDWLTAQLSAPSPPHDDKTVAVVLYSETVLTVQANGRLKRLERRVLRILRPEGAEFGLVQVHFDPLSQITDMHGWGVPAEGKVFEVKAKNAVESAVLGVEGGFLMNDVQTKTLQIPAAEPGNVIGYEFEQELRPYLSTDDWEIQETIPVREAHYTLQLPPGWDYRAVWVNSEASAPSAAGNGRWSWQVGNVEAIAIEDSMPPWRGIARRMFLSLYPAATAGQGLSSWRDLGTWYANLASDRRVASPEIKQKVATLTSGLPTLWAKAQALASFAQNDVRYVAIELGIGGHQPHRAAEVFANRYGDCKDKATLLSTMLKEIGIDSYYVVINSRRGSVDAQTPPNLDFNHMILAIRIPAGTEDPSLLATISHPQLGKLLFFDPTDHLTPLGSLSGDLQANFGLLEAPDGGELVELPQLPSRANGVHRTATMTLEESGVLRGDVVEIRTGDAAARQRFALRGSTLDTDRIKPVELMVANSLATFSLTKATIANLQDTGKPFEWHYSLEADKYAKLSGGLLLVRPRILGSKSSNLLENDELRHHPVEFEGPEFDTDDFTIKLPADLVVDDLPPPVDVDYGFAAYHSKSLVANHVLNYSRSFEIKQLSVPLGRIADLKALYRVIYNDERQMAVFRPSN